MLNSSIECQQIESFGNCSALTDSRRGVGNHFFFVEVFSLVVVVLLFRQMLLSNEALFGIEADLICSRPVDSTDSSLGSKETADETRGIIPAEHNLSVE